ncbi:hypothetical protein [Longimicrobium sp.]|jgi:hypothetical protein|uniref:hypothetical protein n=1 Tax=Longimicrobium sp. TaxID=2029185 RepID=UPI002F94C241
MSQLLRYTRVVAFYALVVTGTLLSIISMVVVLELREVKVPPELSADQLLGTLTSSQQTSESRTDAPAAFQVDSAEIAAARNDTTARGRMLVEYYAAQNRLAEQWQAQRNALVAEGQEAAEAASLLYAAEAMRPGDRDRLLRFVEIKEWHHKQMTSAGERLNHQRASLAAVNQALLALRIAPAPAVHATGDTVKKAEVAAQAKLAKSASFGTLPARQDVGLFDTTGVFRFHPFAALSGWLRTQQSLELASIIGMLGFGLLGAAASTVVRAPRTRTRRSRLGDNLTQLVVSGTTAAFATYLAVKGSLAVVSTDGAEPNPYVLLLTCFVASVYWEDAWERVRSAVRRGREDDDDDASSDEDVDRPKVALPNIAVVGARAEANEPEQQPDRTPQLA